MKNSGDQYSLLLDAIDDSVAVRKSLADRFVVNFRNQASQFGMIGNSFCRFDDF